MASPSELLDEIEAALGPDYSEWLATMLRRLPDVDEIPGSILPGVIEAYCLAWLDGQEGAP